MDHKRILIIGGVAGGASCAARARRLSENAIITLIERGPYVSFANCGLPYHVGGEIPDKGRLLVSTPAMLRARLNIDVRVNTEAVRIDRAAKSVELRELTSGMVWGEEYDELVLSTGAAPVTPPIPGIDRPGHFALRNIPDLEQIVAWLESTSAKRAVVVGGGYIGLETAEQLVQRSLVVALAEALPQVMAPLDPEMASILHEELRKHSVALHLGDGVAAFEAPAAGEYAAASVVVLRSGVRLPADIVILALGVRPDAVLAREAGLEMGELGGVRVDDHMRTSDPHIWAVGDAIEVRDTVTGGWTCAALAGPANRQGRIAADNICGRDARYAGTQGTAILRLFELAAGCTGANEKALTRAGIAFEAIHLHPGSHAGYFPGSKPIALKVLYAPDTGRLLGAQAVGADGVDKRIDVLATALKAGMTVDDLAELELAYAPPFGSAKDPVNLAGMIGQNVRAGLTKQAQWSEVTTAQEAGALILDVREASEHARGHIPGSIHIPLGELRLRLGELPRDREIVVHCHSGHRSYYATRMLTQHGFNARNLSGSWRTWNAATGRLT